MAIRINDQIAIPLTELVISHARSSGPGGQNVNKVNSKVTIRWSPENTSALPYQVIRRILLQNKNKITKGGELLISSEKYRAQKDNRRHCLEALAKLVKRALITPKTRKSTKPTRSSKELRLTTKKTRAQTKHGRSKIRSDD